MGGKASPEALRRATQRYRERHPEKVKAYVEANREQHRAKEYAKYDAAKAAGECVRCYRPSREGKILCSECHKKQLATVRKYKYGLTEAGFSQLIEEQDYRCAICLVDIETDAHVDHNHDTKAVRGLLCGQCNRGIGMFRDNIEALERAAAYLKRDRK